MHKPPERFTQFVNDHPEIGEAYRQLGKAASGAGPLDEKTRALIKVGIAIAAGLEGGTDSATRKALDAGCTDDELRHTAILTVTTLGFPSMMKGFSWVDDVLKGLKGL